MIEVEFNVRVPFHVYPNDGHFIACAHVLNVLTQGDTRTEARNNLVEAIQLFLMSCFERGTLDEVLRESGFRSALRKPKTRRKTKPVRTMNVPLPFMIKNASRDHCRA